MHIVHRTNPASQQSLFKGQQLSITARQTPAARTNRDNKNVPLFTQGHVRVVVMMVIVVMVMVAVVELEGLVS
jgi:hypothetical protein